MKKILILFFALLFSLGLKAQELIIIKSKALKCDDSVIVIKPSKLKKDKDNKADTPSLFLFHGYSGNYKNWSHRTDLQAFADKYGFIIICPDGFYSSWYLNNIDPNKMQWKTFFDKELYPQIKEKYKLNPAKMFITGLSKGGHGALSVFMDDTTRFRAAGSMSGVLYLPQSKLSRTEIAKVIGTVDESYYEQKHSNKLNNLNSLNNSHHEIPRIEKESVINRLESLKGLTKPILVTCGAQDVYAPCTRDFADKAYSLKLPVIEIISPGHHNWAYWEAALDLHLWYFSMLLSKPSNFLICK